MTPEQAARLLLALRGHTSADDALQELIDAAIRYARIRVDWALRPQQDRAPVAELRTAAHNSLIASCNILSRAMLQVGEEPTWRSSLGDDRKAIGDMACHLHCALGIAAR